MGTIGSTPGLNTTAMLAARQALAKANAMVAEDRRNRSPGCVACDQKLVDKAQTQLAQATSAVRSVLNVAA